jgi:aryl-alcohol dehydrogenase-like predicted oxidoreductase
MNLRALGTSGLEISPLGVGTWAMGGDWEFGWGPQEDRESVSAIRRAYELGANWIDTAPAYGLGHAESIVGRAIAELGTDRPLVFTKCGLVWDNNGKVNKCLQGTSVRRECEASLSRLEIEAIDLLQIHWPTGSDTEMCDAWEEMMKMRDEGKVRHLGVCNASPAELSLLQSMQPVTSVQSVYSFIEQTASADAISFAYDQNIGFLAYSPLGSGILTGKFQKGSTADLPLNDWRRKNSAFQGEKLAARLHAAAELESISKRLGAELVETSLAWVLANQAITGAIVGIRTVAHAEANLARYERIHHIAELLRTWRITHGADAATLGVS